MIPQHTSEGDLVGVEAVLAEYPGISDALAKSADTFAFTFMEVAAEVVVTTEPSWSDQRTVPQNTATIPSYLKRPTSLPLDNNTFNKTSPRDLAIFNSEEPHIVEDSEKCRSSVHKSFDFTACEMDVAAQEEVITESTYIEQTTVISKSTSELLSEDHNSGSTESSSDSVYSSDRHPCLEDTFKTCLPLSPDTEKALVTFARFGDSEILLPIVNRGPGFDLIDFINNDFPSAEVISTPSHLKENSCHCSSMHKNCRKNCVHNLTLESKLKSRSFITQANKKYTKQRSYIPKRVCKRKFSKKFKNHKVAFSRHLKNLKALRGCTFNPATDNLKLYRDKRIKNNLSSKMSRDKRKKEIHMKFMELESLRIKNCKLIRHEKKLKDAINQLHFEIFQMKVDSFD